MSDKLKRILLIVVAVAGAGGMIASVVMVVMAFRFGELGRVLLYSVTTLACLEMAILALLKFLELKNT